MPDVITTGKDEYGEDVLHHVWTDRQTLAFLSKSNGAWLIYYTGPGSEDMVDQELFDCASSLATAKRVVREHMRSWEGVKGPYRWKQEFGGWQLEGTVVDEYDQHNW